MALGLRALLSANGLTIILMPFSSKCTVYVGTRHNRVAVIMDDTRLAAGDMQLLASERLDLGVLVERLVEHVETYLRSLQYIERLHDDNVHQSVAHRCLWSDIGVVAILRCVGTRDEEGLVLLCSRLVLESVGFRLILQSFSQNVLSIADGSSFAAFGKLHAYEGVKSHTAGTEERIVVDDSIVEVVNLALVDDLNTFLQVHGQHEVASQSVARIHKAEFPGLCRSVRWLLPLR